MSLTVGTIGSPGCMFVTNTTAIQCRSDMDCEAIGPEFAGLACDLSTHTCNKVADDQDLCVATPTKTANRFCMDKFNGDPAICSPKSHKCVRLKTAECPNIYEKAGFLAGSAASLVEDDNTVVVGLTDSHNCCFSQAQVPHYFAEVALSDVLASTNGAIPMPNGAPGRPMVLLSCPEGQPAGIPAIARFGQHLANEVEVPLVVGPIILDNFDILYSRAFRDARVPTILPFAYATSALQTFPNPIAPTPLAYDIAPGESDLVNLYKELITKELEPRVRAENGNTDVKVLVFTEDAAQCRNTETLFDERLRFNNGKTAAENEAAGKYKKIKIKNTFDVLNNPNPQAEAKAAIEEVLKFQPHIIIHNVTGSAPPLVIFPIMFAWKDAKLPFKPFHLDAAGWLLGYPDSGEYITTTGNRGRVISWSTNRSAEAARVANMAADSVLQRFPNDPTVPSRQRIWPTDQIMYDSVFLAAYMIAANGNKPITPENLAATIPRLTAKGADAVPVNVGITDAPVGFAALKDGKSIDLKGISSNLDIDPVTGRVKTDSLEAWCLPKDPTVNAGLPIRMGFSTDPVAGSKGDMKLCD